MHRKKQEPFRATLTAWQNTYTRKKKGKKKRKNTNNNVNNSKPKNIHWPILRLCLYVGSGTKTSWTSARLIWKRFTVSTLVKTAVYKRFIFQRVARCRDCSL